MLIANPNADAADVLVRYLPASGEVVSKVYTIAGGQRLTRNIALEDPSLANAAVATHVQSTQPVVVERAQYWGQPAWIEAHNSFGITALGRRWGLAEGRVGGTDAAQTYILLTNTTPDTATVTVTFLRTGGTTVVKTWDVAPASRFNVAIVPGDGSMVPELPTNRSARASSPPGRLSWSARSTTTRTASPGPPARTPPPRACLEAGAPLAHA